MIRNTVGNTKYKSTPEIEDLILRMLPSKLKHWVLFESPFDVCLVELYYALKEGKTEAQIMSTIGFNRRAETYAAYGSSHPQMGTSI